MKKLMIILVVTLALLGMTIPAVATELTSCTIYAERASGAPGEAVTVKIYLEDNPGFTNFAIALDYDREHLTLKSLETKKGENPYLCGSNVSINTDWEEDEKAYGFLVSASAEPVKENGVLFAATFEIAPDFYGQAQVTPVVQYIRNNEAVFSIFEQVHAEVTEGCVKSMLDGDVTGDGIIEYNDVMLVYRAFLGEVELTPGQLAMVDTNGNGTVDEGEYQQIYQIYIGG